MSYLKASALTMRLSNSTINYGENVTVSGELTEVGGGGLGDKIVFLAYSADEGRTWNRLVGVLTLPNGTYRYNWKPDGGSYIIRAVWDGEKGQYSGTTSQDQTLTVVRKASSITAKLSSTSAKVGQPVKITSTLSVKSSFGTATMEYSLDKQKWNTIASASPVQGVFSTEWTPRDAGTYYIRVMWSGDAAYEGSSSEILTLTVS